MKKKLKTIAKVIGLFVILFTSLSLCILDFGRKDVQKK